MKPIDKLNFGCVDFYYFKIEGELVFDYIKLMIINNSVRSIIFSTIDIKNKIMLVNDGARS